MSPIAVPCGTVSFRGFAIHVKVLVGGEAAHAEYAERNKIFSPQNWLKAKDSILKIHAAVKMYLGMIGSVPGGPALKKSLVIPADRFMLRWAAD